jgi:hypothetical protein
MGEDSVSGMRERVSMMVSKAEREQAHRAPSCRSPS